MPGNGAPLPQETREQILAMLRDGLSQNEISRRLGCSQSSVSRLAREEGYTNPEVSTANETAARDYNIEQRKSLGNEGFAKLRALLAEVAKLSDMREWSIAYGILVDKRRLEDGEATARTERIDTEQARAQLAGKLDQLTPRTANPQPTPDNAH